jgi:hypothetical protein
MEGMEVSSVGLTETPLAMVPVAVAVAVAVAVVIS